MATKKTNNYIVYELDFLEEKAEELKEYIRARPISKLEDRMAYKETKGGGVIPIVVANQEAQRKDLTQALKDYADIINMIAQMREKEDVKKSNPRGEQALSPMEEKLI